MVRASITIEHEEDDAEPVRPPPARSFGWRAFDIYVKVLLGLLKYGLCAVIGFAIFWVIWAVIVAASN